MIEDGRAVPYFPLKVEQEDNRWRVHNTVDQETYWLNDHGQYLLQLCDGYNTFDEIVRLISDQYGISPQACQEDIHAILDPMTEAGMIWWRRERMAWMPTPPPQSAFWELTWACNLRCAHCVVSAGQRDPQELTTEECRRLADELARLGLRAISFSGGEPLLRKDFFDIAEHVSRLGIATQLATNGTLIDDSVARHLKDLDFDAQITLYGSSPQTHDRFAGVQKAYQRAVHGVTCLKRAGVPVTIATVATQANVDEIPDILDTAIRLEAESFRLIPFIPSGRAKQHRELELAPLEMRELTRYVMTRREQGAIDVKPMEFEHTFSAAPEGWVDPNTRVGCDGATTYCTIGATGEVLPCSYFSGVEAESVKDKPFSWIWSNARFLNYFRSLKVSDIEGPCRECQWLGVCRTGCKAANRAHGDLFGSNRHCWIAYGE